MVPSRLASWTLVRAAERAYSKLAASRSQDRCRSSKSSFWRGRSPGEPENLWRWRMRGGGGGGQMLTNVTSDWQCSSRGESGGFYELVSVDIRPPSSLPTFSGTDLLHLSHLGSGLLEVSLEPLVLGLHPLLVSHQHGQLLPRRGYVQRLHDGRHIGTRVRASAGFLTLTRQGGGGGRRTLLLLPVVDAGDMSLTLQSVLEQAALYH